MKTSRLTVKGQVTLPKELRDRLNLEPGSRVAFEEEADGIKVRPVRKTIMDWAGTLRSPEPGLSVTEIRRHVKKVAAQRVGRGLPMIEEVLLDTNVILRHALGGDHSHREQAQRLF